MRKFINSAAIWVGMSLLTVGCVSQGKYDSLQEQNTQLLSTQEQLKADNASTHKELDATKQLSVDQKKRIEQLTTELTAAKDKATADESQISSLKDQVSTLQNNLHDAEQSAATASKQAADDQPMIQARDQRIVKLQAEKDDLDRQITDLKGQLAAAKAAAATPAAPAPAATQP